VQQPPAFLREGLGLLGSEKDGEEEQGEVIQLDLRMPSLCPVAVDDHRARLQLDWHGPFNMDPYLQALAHTQKRIMPMPILRDFLLEARTDPRWCSLLFCPVYARWDDQLDAIEHAVKFRG